MLLKLALRNVRRSIRDYAIYFVTLLLGVALFYAFNSIGSQEVLFDAESMANTDMFETISEMLGLFTGVVACVLGFLVLYSNSFLIRRRKREFGIYGLLGMSSFRIARIIFYETAIVGVASLVVGLVIGLLLSQGLSFLTSALFGQTIQHYQFIFSADACILTMISFAIIYAIAIVFNVVNVSRLKLISLMQSEKRNQKRPIRNPWACLAIFIVAIAILAYAYYQLIDSKMEMLDDPRFIRATVFMLIGSLLFFWSLAGFSISVISKIRGVYLRKLRPFTLNQIASRVNTAFISLWAVCVLLFFSVTTFSVGMGYINVFVGDIYAANPYSASLQSRSYALDWHSLVDVENRDENYANWLADWIREEYPELYATGDQCDWQISVPLRETSPELWDQTISKFKQIDVYMSPDTTLRDMIQLGSSEAAEEIMSQSGMSLDIGVQAISVSDINETLAMIGEPQIEVPDGSFMLLNNFNYTERITKEIAASGKSIDLFGEELSVLPDVCDLQLYDGAMLQSVDYAIVPDHVVDRCKEQGAIPIESVLNVMYADNGKTDAQNGEALLDIVRAYQPLGSGGFYGEGDFAAKSWPVFNVVRAEYMIAQSGGLRALISYLALYIGLVFLISTAAILSIQQLSSTVDSLGRYRMLWRLGASERSMSASLLLQTVVYFLVPLGLALCHYACAIYTLNDSLFRMFGGSFMFAILAAALLMLVVYGGYLLITYLVSRGMVRPQFRSA